MTPLPRGDAAGIDSPQTNDRREVFAWMLYAWAFHGFVTTVATVLLGPYLTSLAQASVGDNGPVFGPGLLRAVTAKAFFFHCLSLSVFLQVLLLPFLGAIADYTSLKKRLLALFSAVGAGTTCLLFFVGAGLDFRWGGALFVLANLSFGASVVLYNAFLPEITTEGQRDRVSSRGYALGYLGGGLLLAANLAFMHYAPALGLPGGLALRLSLLSAGLWWAAFSLPVLRRLRSRRPPRPRPPGQSLLALGLTELATTFRLLRGRPHTRRYLIAYLLFNDGIQTVIGVAAVFLAQELFVANGRPTDQSFLLGVMLMVQFVGFLGALVFERLAAWTRGKTALVASLVVWSGVVVYGYRFLRTPAEAVWMSANIALVLGGSQALSRSLFSCMVPPGREASFFAIYEISSSGTSWIGPFVFALVVAATNSYRQALLSLIVLFVVGTVLLVFTDVERALGEARGSSVEGPSPRARLAAARPSGWLRRLLDAGIVRLARLVLHVFFREVEVTGLERIPRGAPVVFVANHNNSVVDSVLLLALPGSCPRILAKSTLFSHPVMGPLLALVGGLPVYRSQDPGVNVSRNFQTFARCREVLAGGGQIVVFPEGESHNEKRRLPIKSGAARIVLEAEAMRGPLGVRIVPVGLNYEAKDRFRSKVWVCVGPAIDPAAEIVRHEEEPRAAVRALTERVALGLDSLTPGLERRQPNPEMRKGRALLAAPVFLLGCALNWIPYRIPGWLSDVLSTTADEPATYKLLAGLLAFPLTWAAETAIAAGLAGPAWGLAMSVIAPASGYAALRLREGWSVTSAHP